MSSASYRRVGVKDIARDLLTGPRRQRPPDIAPHGNPGPRVAGSLKILHVEQQAPGANITSASDALWYTIVTISTVGCGDRYPSQTTGAWLARLIIVVGVGIFGTFTGYLANLCLAPSKKAAASTAASNG